MDNTVHIVSGVSPKDRVGDSDVRDSGESSCDFNLWDNWISDFDMY